MSFRELYRGKVHWLYCLRPLYLTQSYFNCTVILFFLFLTIVTYMWTPSTALLSKSMEQIHARFVNCVMMLHGFVKVALAECCHFHVIIKF